MSKSAARGGRPRHRPTRGQLAAARGATIPDVIAEVLSVLFVGINPSLYSAAVGHHFGRPGNRFWAALHDGGWTPRLFDPEEDGKLLELGIGVTNFVAAATARADELTAEELKAGGRRLIRKVRRWRPRTAAFVGITAYRAALERPGARIGLQTETIASSRVWVLPNPSGLNAHYQRPDFARLFADLRAFVAAT